MPEYRGEQCYSGRTDALLILTCALADGNGGAWPSFDIGNGICVVFTHMESQDLIGLPIHSEKGLVIGDLYGLRVGVDLPVLGQLVFNDD